MKKDGSKLSHADLVGLRAVGRDVVANSFLSFGAVEYRDIIGQNVAITNLEARVRKVEDRVLYNQQCINYLADEVLHLQINSTKAKMDKAERILKLIEVDTISRGMTMDRDTVKTKVAKWINEKLGSSIHIYKCISIFPIIPTGAAKFSPYTILKF